MSKTLKYSPRTELILPEYGRNIQHMVEIALKITDRAERNRCVRTIIDCMGNMFPYLRDVEGFKHKLWDHLAIMSGFTLDIDYPYEVFKPEKMNVKPEPLKRNNSNITFMHYGRILEGFIRRLADDENIPHRGDCIMAIANQMKKSYQAWNKEVVDDNVIFEELRRLSNGRIVLTAERNHLLDRRYNQNNGQNKKTGYNQNNNHRNFQQRNSSNRQQK